MSERAINDPSQHGWTEVDGKWMWAGSGDDPGYDDTELRGLVAGNAAAISANAGDISSLDTRVEALESGGGGGGSSLWTDNGDGTISYSGTAIANDFKVS